MISRVGARYLQRAKLLSKVVHRWYTGGCGIFVGPPMSHNLLGMLATLHTLHAELISPCLVESLRRLTFVGISASRTATGATHSIRSWPCSPMTYLSDYGDKLIPIRSTCARAPNLDLILAGHQHHLWRSPPDGHTDCRSPKHIRETFNSIELTSSHAGA